MGGANRTVKRVLNAGHWTGENERKEVIQRRIIAARQSEKVVAVVGKPAVVVAGVTSVTFFSEATDVIGWSGATFVTVSFEATDVIGASGATDVTFALEATDLIDSSGATFVLCISP